MKTYAVTCILFKEDNTNYSLVPTLHYQICNSEDEAKGRSVTWALENNPGYSIRTILCLEVKKEERDEELKYADQYLSLTDAMGYDSTSGLSPEEWAQKLIRNRLTVTAKMISAARDTYDKANYPDLNKWKQALKAALVVANESIDTQHEDDIAVDVFSKAMKQKLAKKREEGRNGWKYCTSECLSNLLREHVEKGDPVDVANLAMMLHQNGQMIEPKSIETKQSKIINWNSELIDWPDEDFIAIFYENPELAKRLRKILFEI